ncbi:MAG: S41 family peptidase [bacterium]
MRRARHLSPAPAVLVCLVALATLATLAASSPSTAAEGYLRFPTISGNTVVFSCEGDLWSVPADGGVARRLTEGEGNEILPRFSPDGSSVAFTAEYDGNNDVYLIPAAGGEARRLTYHPYSDGVIGWTPDGRNVIFRSMRQSSQAVYKAFTVPKEGGFPTALPLDKVGTISFAPDGKRVAFTRTATEFRTWKRYRGGYAQDVWVGDLAKMDFRKLTDFEGTDGFPLWVGERIYFVSDRDGIMNLYSIDAGGGDARQHTFHKDYDVRWPAYAAGRVVYECGGDLYLLDVASDRDAQMRIEVPSDRVDMRPRYVEPAKYVTDFEISPEGRRVVFAARGDLAMVPAKEGRLIELAAGSAQREKFPRWFADGKQLAYVSDATGEDEIYVVDAERKSAPRQVTKETGHWKYPAVPSPDGRKLAYSGPDFTLKVVDVESGKTVVADTSAVWEIREYAWSPDSKWLAYTKPEDERFGSIFLYNVASGDRVRVTDRFTNDGEPVWDPDGKYLYFLSDRTLNPFLSKRGFEMILDKMTKPYLVMLRAGEKSPFFPKEPAEQEGGNGDDNGDEDKDDKKGKDGKDAAKSAEVKIDLDGLAERVVAFPVPAGHLWGLAAASGKIFYLSGPLQGMAEEEDEEPKPVNDLHSYDIEEEEDKVVEGGLTAYRLSANGKKVLVRRDDDFRVVDSAGGGKSGDGDDKSNVDLARWRLRVDPAEEFRQMLEEGWRLQRDFYWVPDMAKIDWDAVRAKYEKLLPRIATRSDLNDLIGNLIGELSTSHTYIWGGDVKRPKSVPVGLLGADIVLEEVSGYYKISKVYPPEASSPEDVSPLSLSHAGITAGDFVLAVNGKPLKAPADFYSAFVNLADEEVLLTVNKGPTTDGARDVVVKTLSSEAAVRYLDWVRSKRERVEKATDGKCGYFHVPDMGTEGLVEFSRTFFPQMAKPALIIDGRYNAGGFVSELIIERLGREILALGQSRRGQVERYPMDAVHAHQVLLTNEEAGSDGDIFPRAFQLAHLGPVVGMRSWGGVVGIRSDKPFVDGGMMTIPEFAWWEAGGGWTLENRGAEPDVVVENLPGDEAAGLDRQLEKAIEIIKQRLAEDPKQLPGYPPYPDKSLK